MSKLSPTFTLSLDCEGLWGMADSLGKSHNDVINDESLRIAYERLERTLGKAGIVATAAFVSSFAVPYDALRERLDNVRAIAAHQPEWFRFILPRLARGDRESLQGLQGHRFWAALSKAGHEIGYHGATHLPLTSHVNEAAVREELKLAGILLPLLGMSPETVVFPRNEVGYLDMHRTMGLRSYRPRRAGASLGKVGSLLRELNIVDGGEQDQPYHTNGWNVSTPGFFLNWARGIRRIVPAPVTIWRWRSILRSSVLLGRHVHMWFHPHNLITCPEMHDVLSEVLLEVSELVRGGYMQVRTISSLDFQVIEGVR